MLKKFIFLFLTFCLLYMSMMAAAKAFWVTTAPDRLERNVIDSDVHTLVLGPSSGEHAWNDSIIPHSVNLCNSAVSLGVSYNSLKWVEDYNDNVHIDTVVLSIGFASFIYFQDKKLPIPGASEEIFSILDYKDFLKFYSKKLSFWENSFTSLPMWWFATRKLGGAYHYIEREKVNHPQSYSIINALIESYGGKYGITEQKLYEMCSYEIHYLRKIKEYCDNHKMTLVVLCTPVYKYHELLDDTGYRQLIRKELGDSALIADYSRFKLPDLTYYGDLEHTNYKGARYFSNHIVKNGLKLQYAIDFAATP